MNDLKRIKPPFVIFVLLAFITLPLIFIIGLVVGLNIEDKLTLSSDSLSGWIGAFSTLVIALLTFILARETWYLRISQINQIEEMKKESMRPNLEIFLMPSSASFRLLNVYIENNGKGTAKNIIFNFFGEQGEILKEEEKLLIDKFLEINFLSNGIKALGTGKQRSSFIFSFLDLVDEIGDLIFEIRIRVVVDFSDSVGNFYQTETILDFSEFKGVSEVGGGDPLYNLYKEAEKIRKVLEGGQSLMSNKRFNVNFYSSDDRVEEKRAIQEIMERNRLAALDDKNNN